jgi:hypothetical protein
MFGVPRRTWCARPPAGTRWQAAGATHGRLQGEERRTRRQRLQETNRHGLRAVAACGLRQPVATSMDGVLIAYHVAYEPDANDQNYNDVEHTVYIGRRGSFTTHGTLSPVRFARAAHALHAPPRPARH